jgi:hypothetical protein
MPRNEGTSLGPQHEQHPNTAQRLLHCGEIQAIIDRLNEAGTNMESHFLANRLQRLSSGSGQRTHAAQQDDSATFGLMHCKKRRARVAMILFWQVLWMELVARELDSFARELARNRKSCTGVAATKGGHLGFAPGWRFCDDSLLVSVGQANSGRASRPASFLGEATACWCGSAVRAMRRVGCQNQAPVASRCRCSNQGQNSKAPAVASGA